MPPVPPPNSVDVPVPPIPAVPATVQDLERSHLYAQVLESRFLFGPGLVPRDEVIRAKQYVTQVQVAAPAEEPPLWIPGVIQQITQSVTDNIRAEINPRLDILTHRLDILTHAYHISQIDIRKAMNAAVFGAVGAEGQLRVIPNREGLMPEEIMPPLAHILSAQHLNTIDRPTVTRYYTFYNGAPPAGPNYASRYQFVWEALGLPPLSFNAHNIVNA